LSRQTLIWGMGDHLRPIEFQAAFEELESYVGKLVTVEHNGDYFFGIAFTARLEAVEALIPGEVALTLRFAGGLVIDVDPAETRPYIGGGREGEEARWLELSVDNGRTLLTLEVASLEETV
jgi:hypothetical protein